MEKKITVYVVKQVVRNGDEIEAVADGKAKTYPTKSRANEAVEILADFGVDVAVFAEKRVVSLA